MGKSIYTMRLTKRVIAEKNLCDHIWVEEVFLTKLGVFLKALATRLDGERFVLVGASDNVVRTYNKI